MNHEESKRKKPPSQAALPISSVLQLKFDVAKIGRISETSKKIAEKFHKISVFAQKCLYLQRIRSIKYITLMRSGDIQIVIQDIIPELLNIGDYRGRVEKCIDVLKTQEYDDIVEMLDTFLTEDEACGFMKEHNLSAFIETENILDICKCCLYESKRWQKLPLEYVSYIRSDHKFSILDIKIGDLLSDAIKTIKRYGVLYDEKDVQNGFVILNDFVWKKEPVSFKLYIYHEGNKISQFCLTTSYRSRKWKVLSVIDEIFADCRYQMRELLKDSVSQIYSSYYDVADVYHTPSETRIRIISAKQYEKENKPWWKI